LCSPFSEKDVETVILSMKFESAPDPNGLTVTFLGNSGNTWRGTSWKWFKISIAIP
jgi:hypothetical protein